MHRSKRILLLKERQGVHGVGSSLNGITNSQGLYFAEWDGSRNNPAIVSLRKRGRKCNGDIPGGHVNTGQGWGNRGKTIIRFHFPRETSANFHTRRRARGTPVFRRRRYLPLLVLRSHGHFRGTSTRDTRYLHPRAAL